MIIVQHMTSAPPLLTTSHFTPPLSSPPGASGGRAGRGLCRFRSRRLHEAAAPEPLPQPRRQRGALLLPQDMAGKFTPSTPACLAYVARVSLDHRSNSIPAHTMIWQRRPSELLLQAPCFHSTPIHCCSVHPVTSSLHIPLPTLMHPHLTGAAGRCAQWWQAQ